VSRRPVVLAVVPARGGSRGVPGKNVALVGGQPLVARAVRAAAGSRYVDHVAVSTDDPAIAAAAAAGRRPMWWRVPQSCPVTPRRRSRPCCTRST
jgi:CMP-N-acetylneuraminic acid synthetase